MKWALGAGAALVLAAGTTYVGLGLLRPSPKSMPFEDLEGPAVAATGSLFIESDPPEATLFVDGEPRGTTPMRVDPLSTGSHDVRLELDGHRTHEGTVEIRADRTALVRQTLQPEHAAEEPTASGRLTLTSEPPAQVFLNGEALGETPLRDVEVPAGVLTLELETRDGRRFRRGVVVRADDATSTHIDLR